MNKITNNLFFGPIDIAKLYHKDAIIIYYGTMVYRNVKHMYINIKDPYIKMCESFIPCVASIDRIYHWMKHNIVIVSCDNGKYISGIIILLLLIKYAINDSITYKDINKIDKIWIRNRLHRKYTKAKKIIQHVGIKLNDMCMKLVIMALVNELNLEKMHRNIEI